MQGMMSKPLMIRTPAIKMSELALYLYESWESKFLYISVTYVIITGKCQEQKRQFTAFAILLKLIDSAMKFLHLHFFYEFRNVR